MRKQLWFGGAPVLAMIGLSAFSIGCAANADLAATGVDSVNASGEEIPGDEPGDDALRADGAGSAISALNSAHTFFFRRTESTQIKDIKIQLARATTVRLEVKSSEARAFNVSLVGKRVLVNPTNGTTIRLGKGSHTFRFTVQPATASDHFFIRTHIGCASTDNSCRFVPTTMVETEAQVRAESVLTSFRNDDEEFIALPVTEAVLVGAAGAAFKTAREAHQRSGLATQHDDTVHGRRPRLVRGVEAIAFYSDDEAAEEAVENAADNRPGPTFKKYFAVMSASPATDGNEDSTPGSTSLTVSVFDENMNAVAVGSAIAEDVPRAGGEELEFTWTKLSR